MTVSSDKGYVLKSLAVLDKDNKEVKLTRVSDGVFAPSMNLTRGMIAQILYNMEEVKASADTAFSDVAEGQLRGR